MQEFAAASGSQRQPAACRPRSASNYNRVIFFRKCRRRAGGIAVRCTALRRVTESWKLRVSRDMDMSSHGYGRQWKPSQTFSFMALVSIWTLFMSTAPLTPFLNCLSLRRFQHILIRHPQQAMMMSSATTPIHITPQYGTAHTTPDNLFSLCLAISKT